MEPEYGKNIVFKCPNCCKSQDNVALVSPNGFDACLIVWCSCGDIYALKRGKRWLIHTFTESATDRGCRKQEM